MAQITLIIFHLSDLPNLRAIISRHQLLKPSEKQILADFAGALIIFHLLNLCHLRAIISRHQLLRPSEKNIPADYADAAYHSSSA